MGVNNRQRRKAKQHRREKQHRAAGTHRFRPPPPMSPAEVANEVVLAAAMEAHHVGELDEGFLHAFVEVRSQVGEQEVDAAFRSWEVRALDAAWNNGWQPADVIRALRKNRSAAHVEAVIDIVVATGRQRPQAAADRRWAAQLDGLAREAAEPRRSRWEWVERLVERTEALGLLLHLPGLPRLVGSNAGHRTRRGDNGAALERVRRLLAKAESTTFPEEAEALTTKAQELMARHAIDEAMLDAAQATTSDLVAWRIGVDDPYAQAKSILLNNIATANGSKAVWSKGLGFSTVFGTEANLERVELLFTSLLVQGTDAMVREGRSVDRFGRSRTRSFRQSFLLAYAVRIGERLAEATESVVREEAARRGDALLPVLAAQSEAVKEAVREVFPKLNSYGLGINNYEGYVAGRTAADRARLGPGDELAAAGRCRPGP